MELSEQDFLEICKTNIEEKYHLGNGDKRLKQRDFEYLIDLIQESSGTTLSISTLKRLWRKTSEQNPHPATLDALVSILGYKDWLQFKVDNAPASEPVESAQHLKVEQKRSSWLAQRKPVVIAVSSLAVIAVLIISFTSKGIITESDAEDVQFRVSNTVDAGVPTTVIFNYDLKDIDADSFYIQQDWDPNNRKQIDPDSEFFTSVYYYPGFHRARIIADDTVLKMEEVFIRTDGWLAAAVRKDDDTQPVYLSAEASGQGIFSVQESMIIENGMERDQMEGSGFFNVGDFGDLDGHNFIAETRFKNRPLSNVLCPFVQFTIHTEANVYFTQFTSMGCVGELDLMIGEKFFSGNSSDLSAFGTDLSEWQELNLTIEDKFATVSLNGEHIFETQFEDDFGKVVGVDYRFSGMGDLDYLRFERLDGSIAFEDGF